MNKRISIIDVANHTGVSIATVSNVINGKGRMSAETINKINLAIEELGYVPSMSARILKTNKSYLIGMIVPTVAERIIGDMYDNPFYGVFLSAIEAGVRGREYHVIPAGVLESDDIQSFILERGLDGVIVVGTYKESRIAEQILEMNIPSVFVDSYMSDLEVFEVGIDDENGGYLGAKHLIDLGHRRIAVITAKPAKGEVIYQRLNGYRRALEESGINFDESLIIDMHITAIGGIEGAQKVITTIKDVTAIITYSDITAMGVIKGLTDNNIAIPNDISLVGFDGLFFANYLTPSLTTISQDIVNKGEVAVKLLLDQLEHIPIKTKNRKVKLPVRLQLGKSTTLRNE